MDKQMIDKPLIHQHPLFPTARFITNSKCGACNVYETMYGGYYCNDPSCRDWFFHKDCAEAILEINHPSHLQHALLLTNNEIFKHDTCDFCGGTLYFPCYSCTKCEFKVHLTCGMKPSPLAIELPLCHDHPLVLLKIRYVESPCEVCKNNIYGPFYSCLKCKNVYFHVECIHFSKEINHLCHSNHPLKLTEDAAKKTCLLCENQLERNVCYHCSICNFTSCLECTRNPPPLVVEHLKTHKHPLTCFSKKISYTCDICGEEGKTRPYICFECDFVIHGKCIHLPQVININRHDHRISFTHHLGVGYLKCGICRNSLSQYNGAYSCSLCPNHAVHSSCAIQNNVWDNVELEGIPDDTEDVAPFKMVGDNWINHFSHEKHLLKLNDNYIPSNEWLQCGACIHPFGFGPTYICEQCSFFLHKKCAYLPRKKRLVFDPIPYTLEVDTNYSYCENCDMIYSGFIYTQEHFLKIDVHCGSLSEPFFHDGHLHPLYFREAMRAGHCDGCHTANYQLRYILCCDTCDFSLCFYCACLPEKIWYRNDEHPLILYYGEKTKDNSWCDNCEKKLNPCKWFYTCFDCEVIFHAQCILGDFSRVKIRDTISKRGKKFEVILNNHNTRPLCSVCDSRCKSSIILKDYDETNRYICSYSCFLA